MTEEYPLYIKWRTVTGRLLQLCGKYPKNVRFNLCDRITNLSLDVLEYIVEAIYAKDKIPIIRKANLSMEKIRALMQLSSEQSYISIKQYQFITGCINECGNMLGGWSKSIK